MLPSSHGKFAAEDFSAAGEARACFGVMAAKEFLVVATVFLILCDVCDVYGNIVRVTGWTHLPFPGNVTAMYYTQIKELNWYDLVISVIDAWCVMLLSLAVCAESLDGLVCSLCGFASSMILELVYVLWLSALVFADSVEESLGISPLGRLLAYTIAPYLALLLIRCYVLVKAQAFRRGLRRNVEWRRMMGEKRKLLRDGMSAVAG